MSLSIARELAGVDLPLSLADLRALSYRFIDGAGTLPLPGRGATIDRWRVLVDIAATDLCLAKILEAHYDAAAILADLGLPAPRAGELWAVWAAEPPNAVLATTSADAEPLHLSGTKAWCSGADVVTHALVTVRRGDEKLMAGFRVGAQGVSAPATAWKAVGMQRVVSGELVFVDVAATRVGADGDYLSRPGFWHGGAGIAACWYGGTIAIAETLRRHARVAETPLMSHHLGVVDLHLAAAAALLRETATLIDAQPHLPHVSDVLRVRSFVERIALDTIERVGRALGPGPLCLDHAHAQRCADLATFVRQSHADRDWQTLGEHAAARPASWAL